MSLDVGELVAKLTVDDARFTTSLRKSDQQMQDLGRTAKTESAKIGTAFTNAGQGADTLGKKAKGATQDLSKVGNTSGDISKVERTSRQAASGVETIGTQARKSAREMGKLGDAAGDAMDDVERTAGGASKSAGTNTAGSFISGFADKLGDLSSKGGPVAGSILGVATLGLAAGAALAKAIQDGMQAELSRDLFQAQTGITEGQARKFAQAAGEAYADAFGTSVEANLNTAKLGLQYGFIDPGATQRDAQKVIETLEGVSTIVGTEAEETARAIGGLINSGLVDNFDQAADLITKASQAGLNRQGDLIDSISEYSAGWKNTGLSATTTMALIKQSLDLGVDNTDRAADAIREFGRRVTEEGDTITAALNGIGLDGAAMYESFKEGGAAAEEAFDKTFDAIRAIEDPVKRNEVAMALLGDTAGDFIGAFAQWDPSEAKRKFGEIEGAAESAMATVSGNAATSVQGAMNSITLAADGLKAALAEAFGPYIQEFADSVSNNRAGVIQFFIDIGNAAFEGGKSVLSFVEGGLRGLAEFTQAGTDLSVSFLRSLADMVSGLDTVSGMLGMVIPGFSSILGDAGSMSDKLNGMADAAENAGDGVSEGLISAADGIHNTLIPALDDAQGRFNTVAQGMKNSAAFNDATTKAADAIGAIGIAADGSTIKLDGFTGSIDRNNAAQVAMDEKVRGLAGALQEQVRTGLEAGATVEDLTAQYRGNRQALIDQMTATGMSREAAEKYINTLGLTPQFVETAIRQPGMPEATYALDILKGKVIDVPNSKTILTSALTKETTDKLIALGYKVETLPDGTVRVVANTAPGEATMQEFITRQRQLTVWVTTKRLKEENNIPLGAMGPFVGDDGRAFADGGMLPDQAKIGHGQRVQWAEPETGGEAFIPLSPAKRPRSEAILGEVAKKFGLGLLKMADGGITGFDGEAAISKAKSKDGEGYVFGDNDCSSYLSEVFNAGTGQSVRFVTNSNFAAMGWKPGYDPNGYSIGTNNGVGANGHMGGDLYGVPIENDGTNGVQYGGSANGAQDFPEVWHWPGASGGNPEMVVGGTSYSEQAGEKLELDKAIAQAQHARDTATSEAERAKAEARLSGLQAQRSAYASGTTSGGAGLSTNGERVFVTNWPSDYVANATGSGSGSGASTPAPGSPDDNVIWSTQLKAFANGGENHTAQIASGGDMRLWAEPETGGEAYIPLGQSKRPRSVALTQKVAHRFGYTLVPMADGGLSGFGGYQGADQPSLDIPLSADGWAGMTGNQRRAAAYNLGALGIGGAFALASGFDENGAFTGKFDTGANSHPGLEKGFENLIPILEQIRDAAQKGEPVNVQVDIDRNARTADIAIMKGGL